MTGDERLQSRLSRIGLSLLAVVMVGGAAGILTIAAEDSLALVVSVSVVSGCVIAVLVALLAALSAARAVRLPVIVRQPQAAAYPPRPPSPVPAPVLAPVPGSSEQAIEITRRPQPAPLWPHPDEISATVSDDPGQRREVFVKLARRLQSLINRSIQRIDKLEQDNEDPVLLDGLYEIDHLFTLARRQGENLAVLGGEPPQRRSNRPVSVYAVLLAAVSEAEHYRQIAIVPVEDIEIHGHAVAEIIHLLAELLENATRFTSPNGPKVEVRAQKVTAGLAIEVQDRGLGMSYEDLERINRLLDGSTRVDISELLQDGRIGLAVVRELARRHRIKVRLQSNIFGGIAAAVVIPGHLLSEATPAPETRRRAQPPATRRERPSDQAVPSAPKPPEPQRQVPVSVASAPAPTSSGTSSSSQRHTAGRRHQAGEQREESAGRATPEESGEGGLPDLPVRAPGRSYEDLRSGAATEVGAVVAVEQSDGRPPPLPQRRGTHLREELLEPPAPSAPASGHNTSLMSKVQEGRDHWLTKNAWGTGAQQSDEKPTRGESTQWPTT
ncbi:MAG: ATP-binding protein [Actinomycetota bacterium]|nr:ATP-binding protein [Actinomycetota bacterium]